MVAEKFSKKVKDLLGTGWMQNHEIDDRTGKRFTFVEKNFGTSQYPRWAYRKLFKSGGYTTVQEKPIITNITLKGKKTTRPTARVLVYDKSNMTYDDMTGKPQPNAIHNVVIDKKQVRKARKDLPSSRLSTKKLHNQLQETIKEIRQNKEKENKRANIKARKGMPLKKPKNVKWDKFKERLIQKRVSIVCHARIKAIYTGSKQIVTSEAISQAFQIQKTKEGIGFSRARKQAEDDAMRRAKNKFKASYKILERWVNFYYIQ